MLPLLLSSMGRRSGIRIRSHGTIESTRLLMSALGRDAVA